MAFILYKKSTDKDRLLCLSYPYRPLLEDYLSRNDRDVEFTTVLHCYRQLSEWRKRFDFWEGLFDDDDFDEAEDEKCVASIVNALLTILYECDCDNMEVVHAIILMYFSSNVDPNYPILQRADKELGKHQNSCPRSKLIFAWQTLHNSYVFNSIHFADAKYLQVLLRYGYKCLASKEEYELAKVTAEKFAKWMSDEYNINHTIISQEVKDRLKIYMGNDAKLWRRKFDIIKGLEGVMRKRKGCRSVPKYAECIKLYFESIPDPFLTRKEVKKLILTLMQGHHFLGMHENVEELCNEFMEVFPDASTHVYNPRSLQHLSRCRVRGLLRPHVAFPKSTDILFERRRISQAMAEYIMCRVPLKYCNYFPTYSHHISS